MGFRKLNGESSQDGIEEGAPDRPSSEIHDL